MNNVNRRTLQGCEASWKQKPAVNSEVSTPPMKYGKDLPPSRAPGDAQFANCPMPKSSKTVKKSVIAYVEMPVTETQPVVVLNERNVVPDLVPILYQTAETEQQQQVTSCRSSAHLSA